MATSHGFSRRRVFTVGAAAAASGAAVSMVGSEAAASPSGPHCRSEVARVTSVAGVAVTAEGQASGSTYRDIPLMGFPTDVTPRAGDLVTITDQLSGSRLEAWPLCSWVTATPTQQRPGVWAVAGQPVVESPRLRATGQAGAPVDVCLLATELPAAQVLAIR